MTTITVPINDELNEFIHRMIEENKAETKAGVVRRALLKLQEEEVFNELMLAQYEARDGKIFKGDLDQLIKKI